MLPITSLARRDQSLLIVDNETMLFVAGNAGSVVWRVSWSDGRWTEIYGTDDTADGSMPHVDCRRYYWEATTSSLLLLSDGGAWLRESPAVKGGRWRSLAGDIGSMEMVSADWDPSQRRWVGGAQDNDVMFSRANASAVDVAVGFIGGDGTVTAVDSSASPSRLWGAVENMGNGESEEDEHGKGEGKGARAKSVDVDDDDLKQVAKDEDDCDGFGFWQGTAFVCIPLLKWFDGSQFPQFVNPWALLSTDPTQVMLFAKAGKSGPTGIYRISVPHDVSSPEDVDRIVAPTLEVPTMGDVYTMIAGGNSSGQVDPTVLVAINDSHIFHRSGGGKLLTWPLPMHYAAPVVTAW